MEIPQVLKNLWNTFLWKCNPLSDEVNALQDENATLRQMLYDRLPESEIVDFFVQDHFGALLKVQGGVCRIVAELLVKEFLETGAINYVEMSFVSKNLAPGEHFVLTIQKSSGMTPHQRLLAVQRELAEEKSWRNW